MMRTLSTAIATLIVGLLIGYRIQSPATTDAAPLPIKTEEYEYKFVDFIVVRPPDSQSSKLNKLASDGWEYAGFELPSHDNGKTVFHLVAFKRAKKR